MKRIHTSYRQFTLSSVGLYSKWVFRVDKDFMGLAMRKRKTK